MKKVELLAPAGNLEKLKFAIAYGADAAYMGYPGLSLRSGSEKYDLSVVEEAQRYASSNGVKLYMAMNVFAYNSDLPKIKEAAGNLKNIGVDGIIVSDPGVFSIVEDILPGEKLHVSTQANTTNVASVNFWRLRGAKRVCLAREVNLMDIRAICAKNNIEIEVFIHGAMCLSYSGRCYLSKYVTGREANKGDCAHNCRWEYGLCESTRPGDRFAVQEDKRGAYILNSKDLNLSARIPELIGAGVNSFKIEGRMKSIHYISVVTSVYRQIIDSYLKNDVDFEFDNNWTELLKSVSHRHYTEGFVGSDVEMEYPETSRYIKDYHFAGVVDGEASNKGSDLKTYKVLVRNKLEKDGDYEFFMPGGKTVIQKISFIYDLKRDKQASVVHANDEIIIESDCELPPMTIIRKKLKN